MNLIILAGMPASGKSTLAKVIAGMVIGALAAAGLLSSCTASYSQSASGDIQFSGTVVVPQKYSK